MPILRGYADSGEVTEESPILVALRNYVLGHGGLGGTDQKETQLAMNVDQSTGTAKGYADGGVVTNDDLGNLPMPGEPQATLPPPSMPPVSPPMQSFLAQSQGLGQQLSGPYTPERRNELYSAFLEHQNSLPSAIGAGLASVGDAIARGYGHSQSDFTNQVMKGQQEGRREALGMFDEAQKGRLAQLQAGMDLGRMDPSSSISKLYQDSYSGPLKKLGYTDAQIGKMSAANIEPVAQVGLKYGDIQAQKDLKEATLQLTAKMNEAQIENMKAGRQAQQQEIKQKQEEVNKAADVEAAKHWFLHPQLAAAAQARLAQGAGSNAPAVAQAAPPHGMTVVQNGHTYTWNPATKKYE